MTDHQESKIICEDLSEHDEAIEIYHNIYKDIFGIRPRHLNFDAMSTDDIYKNIQYWVEYESIESSPDLTHWNDTQIPVNGFVAQLQGFDLDPQ